MNRSKCNKMIFQKNISSKQIIESFIDSIERVNQERDYGALLIDLMSRNEYRGRSAEGSESTLGVRMSEICFYMFGCIKNDKFLPSLTTDLYRTKRIDAKLAMLVNLCSMQFPSPYSKTPSRFEVNFGRLFLKIITDEKIENKLYIDECIWFLPFIEKIDQASYDDLINSICEYRELKFEEKLNLFRSINNSDDLFSNCLHEIKYYFLKILKEYEVIDFNCDDRHNGGQLLTFRHGYGKTIRNDSYKTRGKKSGFVTLNAYLIDPVSKILEMYSPFENVRTMDTMMSKEDWLLYLYNEQQLNYLDCLVSEELNRHEELGTIRTMLHESKYGTIDGKSFEESLKKLWELFRHARNVELISGPGDTDILCVMGGETCYKINVEAKSTKKAVSQLNGTRLTSHLKKCGSDYCIVVSPKFSLGVKNDIENFKVVTITAESLANFCTKELIHSDDGMMDFLVVDALIRGNLGKDISEDLDLYVLKRYGSDIQSN